MPPCCLGLQVSYRKLLDVFFNRVDPTTLNRQGNDRGTQYRSAIYTHDGEQLQEAQQKIAEVNQQLSQVGGCALDKMLGATMVSCSTGVAACSEQ
jgi:peptide-methionine (S)-S-oxide reductase